MFIPVPDFFPSGFFTLTVDTTYQALRKMGLGFGILDPGSGKKPVSDPDVVFKICVSGSDLDSVK
jgi:hypothetical protein